MVAIALRRSASDGTAALMHRSPDVLTGSILWQECDDP